MICKYNPNGMKAFFIDIFSKLDKDTVLLKQYGDDVIAGDTVEGLKNDTDKSKSFCSEVVRCSREILIAQSLYGDTNKEREVDMNCEYNANGMSKFFIGLIKEVPSDTIIYKDMNGNITTAEEMITGLENNEDFAKGICSDILRLSRNFFIRKAESQK